MPGGQTLAQAYVQILPTTKGIKGNLEKEMGAAGDGAGNAAGSKFSGTFKKLAIAGAAAAGAALTKSLLNGAALEQSLGGVETLYGKHADIVINNANKAWKTAGLSANAYMEQSTMFAASLLQSLGGDTEKAASYADMAITDMSDNANKFGTNIEDIQNAYQGFSKQNYTMLDNLKLGYGGTKSEMERLLATADEINAKNGKTTKYSIDNLNDVYDAIHVVQEDLGVTGTTATEAATTLSGSFASMKAAADNFLGNLSMRPELIAQSMQDLVSSTTTFLFGNLIPAIGNVIQALPVAIKTFIDTGIPQIAETGTTLIKSLIDGAKTALPGMIQSLMTGLVNMTGQLRQGFSKFVDLGLTLVKSIANGIIKNIPTFIQTVPQIISNIAGLINDNAPKLLSTGLSIIKSLGIGLIKALPVLAENLPLIAKSIFDLFVAINWMNLGKVAVTGIAKGLKFAAKSIKTHAKDIVSKITSPIKSIPGKISGAITSIKSKLSFSGLAAKVKSVFESIKKGISDKITAAKDKVKEIIEKIKNMFPFKIGKFLSGFIKLPKVEVKKDGKGGAKATSSTSTSNFAKAMNQPYMFSTPTLFKAGEAGDEMLYGRRSLMSDISEVVRDNSSNGEIIINLNYDASDDATDMLRDIVRGVKRYRMAGAF